MKKYIGWLLGVIVLAAVIVAASVLYDEFSGAYSPGGAVAPLQPMESFGESTTLPAVTEPDLVESESEPIESETSPLETETEPVESESTPAETEPLESESIPVETEPVESETAPLETDPPIIETDPPETEPLETEQPKPTLKYPDFTALDVNGNQVKLSDYTGKPIVLNFWASWCGYCLSEMPDFEAMYKKYGDRVNFLMVNVGDDSLAEAKKFATDKGYTFPVYFDSTGEASYAYGASSIPLSFFFYADGNPAYYAMGMISGEVLEDTILKILNH